MTTIIKLKLDKSEKHKHRVKTPSIQNVEQKFDVFTFKFAFVEILCMTNYFRL